MVASFSGSLFRIHRFGGDDIEMKIVPGSWCCRVRESKAAETFRGFPEDVSTGENSTSGLSIPEADKEQRL